MGGLDAHTRKKKNDLRSYIKIHGIFAPGGQLPTQEKRLKILGNEEISGKCLNLIE